MSTSTSLDTSQIKDWRSIITLIVFVITNINVLFPFRIPIPVPWPLWKFFLNALSAARIIPPRSHGPEANPDGKGTATRFKYISFHMDFVTAPLIADLFLLAILAIGEKEVHDGTLGTNDIFPINIMAFFLTLAYIAISIDASGLIRYLAFKVLQKAGKYGHRLFFYLYLFFFGLTSFVGNDPIVLSGTAFLAYMTRVSANIKHPRAWIHMQFATANIGSAILVSSNPTNLVLAGAFSIKFIDYTANMIVPVIVTAIVLFPFLLWVIFPYESLIPSRIELHDLPDENKERPPVNPNIPNARGDEDDEESEDTEQIKIAQLEEIMNPFLDKKGAIFGAVIMAVTLITILAVNASSSSKGQEYPIYWITCPAAFLVFCWDLTSGWKDRKITRKIARDGRQQLEVARIERGLRDNEAVKEKQTVQSSDTTDFMEVSVAKGATVQDSSLDAGHQSEADESHTLKQLARATSDYSREGLSATLSSQDRKEMRFAQAMEIYRQRQSEPRPTTLYSSVSDGFRWCQETFPTVTTVASHLPWKLVPFAFCMFVLVQALVTKGWVPVFAYGWDHWVDKTGVVGAIGGMAFLSVILCNFAGTNIGTTILLCRVIQTWVQINNHENTIITQRTFWATVYSMAIGVNYGAFSTAFSASLAGLLWRDILARKHIKVLSLDFARVNLPIIAITMVVGCVVLIGEIYITRDTSPHPLGGVT